MGKTYQQLIAESGANRDKWLPLVQREAARQGIDWRLPDAIFARESRYNPTAYNPHDPGGARGIGQIIASTARGLGLQPEDAFDPHKAIPAAVKMIADLNRRAGGDWRRVGLGYNTGNINSRSTGTDNYAGYMADVQAMLTGRGAAPQARTSAMPPVPAAAMDFMPAMGASPLPSSQPVPPLHVAPAPESGSIPVAAPPDATPLAEVLRAAGYQFSYQPSWERIGLG